MARNVLTKTVFFIALLVAIAHAAVAAAAGQTVTVTNDTDYLVDLSLKMNVEDVSYGITKESQSIRPLPPKSSYTFQLGSLCPRRIDGEANYAVFKKQAYSRCVGTPYTEGFNISCPLDCTTTATKWKIQLQGNDFHFVKQ